MQPLLLPHSEFVKAAIIDTGALFDSKVRKMYGERVKEVRSFVEVNCGDDGVLCPAGEDVDGHGTHATSLFLEVDPLSEFFVAKVFESRDEKQSETTQDELHLRIAKVQFTSE